MDKDKAKIIFEALDRMYPFAATELHYNTNFELLIAVMLSAQCTDKRVNIVTDKLFKLYNTPQDFANLEQSELERMIYSCGFYRNKAKNIISASRDLLSRYGGELPSTLEELTSLDGVGRKTANVILSVAFSKEAFAVDTHVFRVTRRIGLAKSTTVEGVEREVTALLEGQLSKSHHLLIFHGRYCCHSRRPCCDRCSIVDYCAYYQAQELGTQKSF